MNQARLLFRNSLAMKILSAVILFLAWEYAARIPISPAFPSFVETMVALWAMIMDLSLIKAYAVTLKPLILGLIISIFLGVGIGVLMGLNRISEWLCSPVFIVMQAAPIAALIPVLTLVYGIGMTSKVFIVCIMAMPVIALNSLNAVRNTSESLIDMGRSFLGDRYQIITKIIIPAASPMIFAGLRLGCAAGFIGIILGELLITPTGIGDIITYNQAIAAYDNMYAAIFSVIAFSVLFLEVIERLEVGIFRPEKKGRKN